MSKTAYLRNGEAVELHDTLENEQFIIELEKGVWLAPWQGDPGRTLNIKNAKQYKRKNMARHGLKMARKYRPFANAKIKRAS